MELKLVPAKIKLKVNKKKAIQNLFDLNWGSAITEIFETDASVEQTAFSLMYSTTRKTNVEFAKELDQEKLNQATDLTNLLSSLEADWSILMESEVVLKESFFQNVVQHNPNYLLFAYNLFATFIEGIGIKPINDLKFEYYLKFRQNLASEYNSNKQHYSIIEDFFNNPIAQSNDSFQKMMGHYIEIKEFYISKLQSGVEDAKETLKDIYVAPNFIIHKGNLIKANEKFEPSKKDIDINAFLKNYLTKGELLPEIKKEYNLIYILGQPGQGKTSLCYRLIFDLLEHYKSIPPTPLCFLKIRDLHAKDFVDHTFDTINKALKQNFSFDKDACILILDGLDELYMSGGISENDLKNLFERLNKTSQSNSGLKIVLTSRLNFLDPEEPSVEGSLILKIQEFTNPQILEYVDKFKAFYPENKFVKSIESILTGEKFVHIKELIEQPVLLYFIAISNIDINADDSKANIYDKIFDSLAKRSWDNNGQLSYINPVLRNDHSKYAKYLRRFIRKIAFEIYQSPQLYITVNKLLSLEASTEFMANCFTDSDTYNDSKINEISKYLLISFYFQKSKKETTSGDSAIEFFHNSLWEYLTAEFIWEEYKKNMLVVDEDDELLPIELSNYYNLLQRLIGNKEFSHSVKDNLVNIIRTENKEIRERIFDLGKKIHFKLVEKGVLLNYDYKKEKLLANKKLLEIFELSYVLMYWPNFDLDNKVTTNTYWLDFYFNPETSLSENELYRNIDFTGFCYYQMYFYECEMYNVNFIDCGLIAPIRILESILEDVQFKMTYNVETMEYNKISNTIFEGVHFSKITSIKNNIFTEVEMRKCGIPDEESFEILLTNNTFDSKFIEKHHVIKEVKQSSNNENHEYYYITLK